ncbi:MAG: SUMF1/EgtB/PvdO family nonheme iron enzyme [Candidatus Electronema sp. VV]
MSSPKGPSFGLNRVTRGGSWCSPPKEIRAAYRFRCAPDNFHEGLGFRLVLPVQAGGELKNGILV